MTWRGKRLHIGIARRGLVPIKVRGEVRLIAGVGIEGASMVPA